MSQHERRDTSPQSSVAERVGSPSSGVKPAVSHAEAEAALFHQIAEHTRDVLWVVGPRPDGTLRIEYENEAYAEAFGADASLTQLDKSAWIQAITTPDHFLG